MRFFKMMRLLFSHDTDKKAEVIAKEIETKSQDAGNTARDLKDLLAKNGVTMKIFIATGGDKR